MNALDRFRWNTLGDLVIEDIFGVCDILEAVRSEFVASNDELARIASETILELIRSGTTYAFRVDDLDDADTAASYLAKRVDIEVISELSGKPVVEWVAESRVARCH